jgi:hypothetical protein
MVYRGKIENGMVVLEGPDALPRGAPVTVRLLKSVSARAGNETARPKTVYERLRNIVGIAKDLPPDLSINHDHYLYGAPKRM